MQGFFLTSFTFFAYARKRSFFGGVISCRPEPPAQRRSFRQSLSKIPLKKAKQSHAIFQLGKVPIFFQGRQLRLRRGIPLIRQETKIISHLPAALIRDLSAPGYYHFCLFRRKSPQRIQPLPSVHATEPAVRCTMMHNPTAGTSTAPPPPAGR